MLTTNTSTNTCTSYNSNHDKY